MGLKGEGPVILSTESRRRLRLPLIGGNLLSLLGATFFIWLGPRSPDAAENWFIVALGLTFAGIGWPLFVLKNRVLKDGAFAQKAQGEQEDAAPRDRS